jgi:two-component system, OmpR family, sensor kinase
MRRRVFWKLLLGFWVTSLLISVGVWLMFTLLRPVPPPVDTISIGDIAATAAKSIIEQDGEQAFETQRKSWPGFLRGQIRVVPGADVQGATAVAKDPSGQSYSLVARSQRPRRGGGGNRGPFDIPWEVLISSLVGGLGFSALLAWYLTSPVRRIRAGFERLARGDFSTRLGPSMGRRRDEIADLARDFDLMAKRLEELVSARDRLLAGVSHELRTPLARLQLSIGLARQDPSKVETSLDRISREAQRLDEMVGEILTLSKLESGVKHTEDYFDFAEVVRLVTEDAKFEGAPLGVSVDHRIVALAGESDWIALGSGRLVSHAVENIVRNALRYSKRGQAVEVILDRDTAGLFRLTVTDEGPGVPDAMLDTMFKPFVQGGGENSGYGLGLAIAERAITAHGGTISAHNRTSGGLCVVVCLPPAAIESAPEMEMAT